MKLFNHKEGKHWEFIELIAAVFAADMQDNWDTVWKRLDKPLLVLIVH